MIGGNEERISFSAGLMAGMVAGCMESIIALTPTERVKTAL